MFLISITITIRNLKILFSKTIVLLMGVLLLVVVVSCENQNPEKIFFGKDYCDHCHMTIADHKFGGELVTIKGKVFKFDSLECMKSYEHNHSELSPFKKYVVNSSLPGELLEAETAKYLIKPDLRSPMGGLGVLSISKDSIDKDLNYKTWNDIYSNIDTRVNK